MIVFHKASILPEGCYISIFQYTAPVSDREVEKQILAIDKRRASYYKYYTGRNWTDAGNYDMCLNTGNMDYETCVKIVKSYLEIREGK